MKIAIDYREAIRENKAGKGMVVWKVVNEWKKIQQTDEVFLLADQDFDISDWPKNFHKVVYPWSGWWWHIRAVWDIWWMFDRYVSLTSYLAPWISFSGKCILMVHDLVAFKPELAVKHNQKATRLEKISLRGAIKNARKIIVPSQSTGNDLQKFSQSIQDKVCVVPLGVDRIDFSILDTEKVKEKFGVKDEYVLFVGTLEPRKNLDKLIRAVVELAEDGVWQGDVVLAGKKGWYFEQLVGLKEKIRFGERVRFVGYVSDEEKYALMQGAKLFYFVSNYEGFGLPILEAMTMGTPVLTSNVSSLPEVAGRAAMMVNPDSLLQIKGGIRELLTNQNFADELVAKGKKQAKKYNWGQTAEKMWQIVVE